MNPASVVACWRKRQQLYSSATFFDVVGADLKAWINGDAVDENDEEAVRKHEYEVRICFLNTHLFFETHICFLKYTFAFWKHTFAFWKYAFAFWKTHLPFETHICLLKHTFVFKTQIPLFACRLTSVRRCCDVWHTTRPCMTWCVRSQLIIHCW